MIDALAAATRGLQTEEGRFAGAAQDVAEVDTPGYEPAGAAERQGALLPTGAPLDLGIAGGGYFQVTRADGSTGYTRNGSFRTDAKGRIMTASGEQLSPPISIPAGATDVRISASGDVSAAVSGSLVPLGKIDLAGFRNPDGLVHTGDGLLSQSAASGPPGSADGMIVQGGLEASGTDLADATVTQITASAAYTALGSVFRTADEMQGALLDMIA